MVYSRVKEISNGYLDDKAFTGIVVSLSLTTPLELNLVPLEVLLIFHDFHESLQKSSIMKICGNTFDKSVVESI